MQALKDLLARTRFPVVLILTLCVGLGLGALSYFYYQTYSDNYYFPADTSAKRAAQQEWRLASADHEILATAIAACSKIYNLYAQPQYIQNQFRLWTGSDGRSRSSDKDEKSGKSEKETALQITNYHRTAIFLSDSIARNRFEAAVNANNNYSNMFNFQLSIIIIGAITTVLISIKSISNSENWATTYFWIGIFAIIFSSIGTATSTLNAFFGPREAYFRTERSLASLRQLHTEIAARIASSIEDPEKCPSISRTNKDDPYAQQVQEWTTRLSAILNASDTAASNQTSKDPAGTSNNGGAGKATAAASP
jgi:hypothetical protein